MGLATAIHVVFYGTKCLRCTTRNGTMETMTAITFEIYDALRSIDVPEEKAQSVARAFDQQHLLTKGDINNVERALKSNINGVEKELKGDIAGLDQKIIGLDKKVTGMEKEMSMIKWIVSIIAAAVLLPLVKTML